jgi:hypothetical protein
MRHRRSSCSTLSAYRHFPIVAALLCGAATSAFAQAAAQPPAQQEPSVKPEQPLSADDVSWLFPAPTRTQPVVKNADDTVTPLDMTAHLIFNFTSGVEPSCWWKPSPTADRPDHFAAAELAALPERWMVR